MAPIPAWGAERISVSRETPVAAGVSFGCLQVRGGCGLGWMNSSVVSVYPYISIGYKCSVPHITGTSTTPSTTPSENGATMLSDVSHMRGTCREAKMLRHANGPQQDAVATQAGIGRDSKRRHSGMELSLSPECAPGLTLRP